MIPAGRIPSGRKSQTQLGVWVLWKLRIATSSFVPQILQTAGAEVSMIRMPDCSFSAGIVFLSVSGGLFGISPAAKGKPHRLHTDTWIGLTSPHCLHFELVIERSEIPMLSNPTVDLTRRIQSSIAG